MNPRLTVVRTDPADAASPVYWTCACGAAGDEDWPTPADAAVHYHAVHVCAPPAR